MSKSLRFRVGLTALASSFAVMGLAAIPSASAASCAVTVVLLDGQSLHFTLPAGAAISTLNLPTVGVQKIIETCPTSSSTTTTTTTTTTSTGATKTTVVTKHKKTVATKPAPKITGRGHAQKPSQKPAKKQKTTTSAKPKPKVKPKTSGKGVPTPANPTYSFATPGPAPLGVPNFFIDSFQIPPFLLPIYQAAGIQYDVPWQVLAAINEIETDYGRNLSVSTAGAVGWMQFLPSTWKQWGIDANGDGIADPYNPVDAIFSAARYLHAAGASKNLTNAIFAYNHAAWYVESVLLRAKLIGGMPTQLIGALTGLVEGHFPVAAPAKYADDAVTSLAKKRVTGSNAAIAIASDPHVKGTAIFAHQGSPVIAANDGKVVKIGYSTQLGRYLELQDATGNVYTYAQLGSITKSYPVPRPASFTVKNLASALAAPATTPKPKQAASAGAQRTSVTAAATKSAGIAKTAKATPATTSTSSSLSFTKSAATATSTLSAPMVKERLFANPNRPASYAAGGALQIQNTQTLVSSFSNYFADTLHLGKNQYTLKPLKVGSIVVAGTILGRIAAGTRTAASHLWFMIQPAGKNAPQIDPKPILDGWKLLEATAVYRAAGKDPFFGPGAKNATVGEILLMSKAQLTQRVLQDPHVQIYPCGRRDITAGLIDRRVLAVIEFLSASGLDPYVSGLDCGHSVSGSTGVDQAGATGESVDISKINGVSVAGHQGPSSITDVTIRRLLTLQGAMRPDEIVSAMSYSGQSNTLALPDHRNRIQVSYTPLYGQNKKLAAQVASALKPAQWIQLINRIGQIPEPLVPISPSKYAIRVSGK